MDLAISISALVASAACIVFVLRAYRRAVKSAERGQNRVQCSVETAPPGKVESRGLFLAL